MPYRSIAVATALLVSWLVSLPAATVRMPLEEVRPGMTGVGVTVFEGTQREEFKVHIIGVLHNATGPRRNLILVKLEGGPLAETGIIQGMSGSPVYIDGRLVGAVSYSLGRFSKEAIAGVTPIDEMIAAVSMPARRAANPRAPLPLPVTQAGLAAVIRQTFSRARPFAERPSDVQAIGLPIATGEQMGMLLRPIATPLVMAGFHPDVRELLAGAFRGQGFAPLASGGAGFTMRQPGEPLQPGDAVGASLISGDLVLAGTGTVTLVEDDRVYAFGHRFYNLGPTQLPMTRAYVHTLLPSLATSSKIVAIGEVIGAFDQDRATAIAGTLGASPRLIPITVSLDAEDRNRTETFTFQVVNDQLFTPLLTQAAILNTLFSYERELGATTFIVKGKAIVKQHTDVTFEDVFTGNAPSVGVAIYIAAPIASLLGNDFEQVELEALEVSITSIEEPRTATLERVWLDAIRPRAGQTVPLKVLTRTYRGEEVTRTLAIQIPPNAIGKLSLLVSDGTQLAQREQRELRQPREAANIEQMIRALNKARKNDRLYVKLLSAEPGAVVNGEILSSLPASVLAVFEADRSSGSFIPLDNATLREWEILTEHAVTGSRLLTINVEPE